MASSHLAGDIRDAAAKQTRRSIWSGVLAGVGLVAFIDETVFHQLLAACSAGRSLASIPSAAVRAPA
jgi:uncharacterized membrane protein